MEELVFWVFWLFRLYVETFPVKDVQSLEEEVLEAKSLEEEALKAISLEKGVYEAKFKKNIVVLF